MPNQAPESPPILLEQNTDITAFNTMALPVSARYYAKVHCIAQIAEALAYARDNHLPVFVLGGGSNVIFTDDYPGLVLHMAEQGIVIQSETDTTVTVTVAAGENWDEFLQHCMANGWYGLENLAIIPGTVGAAPVQNIGAYGQEVADCIEAVHTIDRQTLEQHTISNADCGFAYRDSIFKSGNGRGSVITHVTFTFDKQPHLNTQYGPLAACFRDEEPTPEALREAVILIRREKLPEPAMLANTGSFFKNPLVDAETYQSLMKLHPAMPAYPQPDGRIKLAAGWLIEQCGFKGKRCGSVGMYERQALVLCNYGGAAVSDILQLVGDIQAAVKTQFGVKLSPEPVFVGAEAG